MRPSERVPSVSFGVVWGRFLQLQESGHPPSPGRHELIVRNYSPEQVPPGQYHPPDILYNAQPRLKPNVNDSHNYFVHTHYPIIAGVLVLIVEKYAIHIHQ